MVSSILRNVLKPRCRRAVTLTLACVLGFGTTGFAQDIELLPSPSSVRAALARPVPDDTVDTRGVDLLKVIADTNGHEPLVRPAPRGATLTTAAESSCRQPSRIPPPASDRRRHRGNRRLLDRSRAWGRARRRQLHVRRPGHGGLSVRLVGRSRRRRGPGRPSGRTMTSSSGVE